MLQSLAPRPLPVVLQSHFLSEIWWLVDDLYGSSPPAMTAAELRGNVLLYETESEFGMSDGRSSSCTSSQGDSIFSDGTAASTPASTPTQSICDPTCLSKDYIPSPAAPRLLEPVLPTSSVVGAFRVPRTPLPRMVIPASADAVGWFPPPHLVHKMSVYTPPTEYRLLPQVTPPVTLAKPVQSFAGSSLSSSISSHSAHVNTPGDSSESQLTPGPALHDFPSSTGYAVMVG
ncbi:uncharacterized protein EI90DRAFT_920241 [Cantharellus anzutake]|uniref:uncharacterized protein n=1 Tax=Cantharellus anzutake TaxID=1750568 RepID=UPI001905D37A|nr:uncharacterized protein EI90DRAFT_920241 [Cantharellus anzutake]KAF8332068.1 hypothetical protein EI90DRAFT_920241 [Cantharellus anzutake]